MTKPKKSRSAKKGGDRKRAASRKGTRARASKKGALEAPPPPPEGKPFKVGEMTATVRTTKPAGGPARVTLHVKRHIRAPPEVVYQAFLDPDILAAWMPPHGFVGRTHSLDARVGGKYRMSFMTATKSWSQSFGGTYLELEPHRKIVHTDAFETDDPAVGGEMRVTILFAPRGEGTDVEVTQEGIPAPMAAGSPYGWSQSFEKLALLLETPLPF